MDELDQLAQAAIEELTADFYLPPKRPGDITKKDLMVAWDVSETTVLRRMEKKIKAGTWHSEYILGENRKAKLVYRRGAKPE